MNYEENDISSKSPMITLVLLMIFGSLGAHRFYVGKYITGFIYFIFGSSLIAFQIIDFKYAIFSYAICMGLLIFDLYAIYSDSFTDRKDKLVIGKEKCLVYETYEERDKEIFLAKLEKFIIILSGLSIYILYYVIRTTVL